jgi:hypothetical protein
MGTIREGRYPAELWSTSLPADTFRGSPKAAAKPVAAMTDVANLNLDCRALKLLFRFQLLLFSNRAFPDPWQKSQAKACVPLLNGGAVPLLIFRMSR